MKINYCAILLLCLSGHSLADETLFNVFSLQAQSEQEIVNDQMRVILSVEHQNVNPNVLSNKINSDMQWALAQIKKSKKASAFNSKSMTYNTYPVYKNERIVAWQASQQLEIKSEAITALNNLVGKLQERLLIKQMSFIPTDQTRKQAENKLLNKALDAFKARAAIIQQNMQAKSYKIVDVNINTGNHIQPMQFRQQKAKFSMAANSAPAVEAGTSKIVVTVNGRIQLQ